MWNSGPCESLQRVRLRADARLVKVSRRPMTHRAKNNPWIKSRVSNGIYPKSRGVAYCAAGEPHPLIIHPNHSQGEIGACDMCVGTARNLSQDHVCLYTTCQHALAQESLSIKARSVCQSFSARPSLCDPSHRALGSLHSDQTVGDAQKERCSWLGCGIQTT